MVSSPSVCGTGCSVNRGLEPLTFTERATLAVCQANMLWETRGGFIADDDVCLVATLWTVEVNGPDYEWLVDTLFAVEFGEVDR